MAKLTAVIPPEIKSVRVDKYLADIHPEYSRAALAKLFVLNLIKFNGEPIQPGYKMRSGNEFEYDLGPLQAVPDVIQLPILYENDDVIVVDKPAGIISHARGRFWQEASVASFIRDRISGMNGDRGGIVHRLDRATSGVMICAKNEKSLSFLQKQFSDRKVEKSYIAVVAHEPKTSEAIIDAPIARNANDPKKFHVAPEGKESQTTYRVIGSNEIGTVIHLKPKTGRTHQLRVHLNYIGSPIIGDGLYGGSASDRLYLHAYSLNINLPDGSKMQFISQPPKEFNLTYNMIESIEC